MKYLSLKETCERTTLKYSHILALVNKGKLPARKIVNGKKAKYLFLEKEIVGWIESCKIKLI